MILLNEKDGLKLYELEVPVDLTDQNEGKKTLVMYEVQGLDVDVSVILQDENEDEQTLLLGHMIGETGLIVNLPDKETHDKAEDFVMESLAE